ncbi:hypothetical protein Ocin01_09191 [Orchesella cincta]|uniref:Uncharacterized protein n=1 Tax=Orchesella cincta TaxID=48709 RepID=A0A1D2MXR1_ORCCI|nr:hypothetical protein Ocin01_09191 [Orchesella cincta]
MAKLIALLVLAALVAVAASQYLASPYAGYAGLGAYRGAYGGLGYAGYRGVGLGYGAYPAGLGYGGLGYRGAILG